jgi:PAS domain S-box-containing protein
MTLRSRILWIIGSTLIGLFLLLFIVSSTILLEGFVLLEKQSIKLNLTRASNVLLDEVKNLLIEAEDYAAWDDAYAFMISKDQAFINSNLGESTFDALDLHLLAILDRHGDLILGYSHDALHHQLVPLPSDFIHHLAYFSIDDSLDNHEDKGQKSGLLLLAGQILLIASYPILTSQSEGPHRGVLIMGRLLNEEKIEVMSRLTQSLITIQPLIQTHLSPDMAQVWKMFKSQQTLNFLTVPIQFLTHHKITGYSLIPDIYQQPIALLRVEMPRIIYQQGLVSLSYLSAFVFLFVFVIAIIIFWLFETLMLKRLSQLSQEVKKIDDTSELSAVTVTGKDELTHLAIAINDMLTRVRQSETSLAEAQRITHLGNWDWDIDNNRFYCSNEIYRIFGLKPQSKAPSYELFLNYVHPQERRLVSSKINKAISENQPYSIEHRIIQQNDTLRYVHTQGDILWDNQGNITHFIGTLQDITEYKLAQLKTLQLLEENKFLIQNLIYIQEIERRELARELHDEFGQCITAIQADTETIIALAQAPNAITSLPKIALSAQAILEVSTHIYDVVHSLMRQLRPDSLDLLGLTETLKELISNWQQRYPEINCTFTTSGEIPQLGETSNITLYRVVQECLTNIAKYANATEVLITLTTDPVNQTVILTVCDNGSGIHQDNRGLQRGIGLIGMRERAQALQGNLQIHSSPQQGTQIIFTIPLFNNNLNN